MRSTKSAMATLFPCALLGAGAMLMPCAAHAVDCHAGTLVTVVAHLDDDLLFVNPGINDKLDAGWCVTTVHLIGGANGADLNYVLTRETAARQAYARMAGVANDWDESTVEIAGKPLHQMVLKGEPRVALLELRLPGGAVRGGSVPLGLLWDEGATLSTYPMNADGTGRARYDRRALAATLRKILAKATEIFTLNPDTVPFIEHPDHIYAARMTRNVAQTLGINVPIRYHVTYPTGGLPMNVPAAKIQKKRDEVASYFAIDGSEYTHVFGEYQWDGNWVARRYLFEGRTDLPEADFKARKINLVNAYSSQCLTSGGAGAAPRLAACSGLPAQDWHWQPVTSYPGNPHDASLVSDATQQCVAERDGRLAEESCDPADLAQRWTPWDFGLVRTPLRHCLGAQDGALAIGACTALTAAYRWAPTPLSQWTDLRLEGAMYADVTDTGKPSAVYVQRRRDGPGFDVWVADLARGAPAVRWYANAVPFDVRAVTPTCVGDKLCFDETRFLVGDFEGNGRADLMAIAPRRGGTAFWLMRSTGKRFEAPRLWYQSTPEFPPALAQQYVAADFTGSGRADVLIAHRPSGPGLNLWVLTSNGLTGNAPALWLRAPGLAGSARLLPAHLAGSPRIGLIALENLDSGLGVTQLASSGRAFSGSSRTDVLKGFLPAFAKVVAGDVDGDGVDDLIVLSARNPDAKDHANIDVRSIKGGTRFGEPTRVATLADVSWADEIPALVRNVTPGNGATLVLFKRANAVLGDTYFTGGAPGLLGYDVGRDFRLGPAQNWGDLPGLFSETLRLGRLKQ
jgi:LmbE family N-acetylglucosaminyl deacetylase